MSRQFIQQYTDPKIIKDNHGNAVFIVDRLGSGTPNDTTGAGAVYNVASGNSIAEGCILINTTGRIRTSTYGYIWVYEPTANNGSAIASPNRWTNIV